MKRLFLIIFTLFLIGCSVKSNLFGDTYTVEKIESGGFIFDYYTDIRKNYRLTIRSTECSSSIAIYYTDVKYDIGDTIRITK